MKNLLIIGDRDTKTMNGQTQKVRNTISIFSLSNDYNVDSVDTSICKKNIFIFLNNLRKVIKNQEIVIVHLGKKGLLIVLPIVLMYKKKYKFKLFHNVIGGRLPQFVKESRFLKSVCSKVDGTWVESPIMKEALDAQGFNNVEVIRNFRSHKITNVNKEEVYHAKEKKFVIFSRVSEDKGIVDAISAMDVVYNDYDIKNVKMHIYGTLQNEFKEKFNLLLANHSNFIEYKGVYLDDPVELISKYNALLFLTFYPGEGVAGTIVDAFFSKTPIIATDFAYNGDLCKPFSACKLVDVHDYKAAADIIRNIALNKYDFAEMSYENDTDAILEFSQDFCFRKMNEIVKKSF